MGLWRLILGPWKTVFEGPWKQLEARIQIFEIFGVSFGAETRTGALCALTSHKNDEQVVNREWLQAGFEVRTVGFVRSRRTKKDNQVVNREWLQAGFEVRKVGFVR